MKEEECPCCKWMEEEFGVLDAAPFETLIERGVELPDPAIVSDDEIHDLLWRTIDALASVRIFLECTDHLSDRELYEKLWSEELRQDTWFAPDDPWSATHIDFSGSCGQDLERYLRYYADDEMREDWRERYPEDEMPPRETPPFARDALLPRPEYPAPRAMS